MEENQENINENSDIIKEILDKEVLDDITIINILINTANITFDSQMLTDVDRSLIVKALESLKIKINLNQPLNLN